MKQKCLTLSVFFLILCLQQHVAAEEPWELVKHKNGIEIYRRKRTDSPLYEFRGTGLILAPISRILAIFSDTHHASDWMHGVVEQKMLKGSIPADISAKECSIDLYNRVHIAPGFQDRDVVVLIRIKADLLKKEVWAIFNSINDPNYHRVDNVVRMPFLNGHWRFQPTQGGKATWAEYQVHASPGSWLPNWLINLTAKNVPFETISGLQKQAQEKSYPGFEQMISSSDIYRSIVENN